jgi:hypothetical protein
MGAIPMEFNDLLERAHIEPCVVLMPRHPWKEPKLRTVLPWSVDESHDLFDLHQQTLCPRVENALQPAISVAEFIGREPQRAVFVRLYKGGGSSIAQDKHQFPPTVVLAQLTGQLA